MADQDKPLRSARRGLLNRLLVAAAGLLVWRGRPAEAVEDEGPLQGEGQVVRTTMRKGRPPLEPLDTMLRFERSDENNGRAMTHEVLSLVHEEKGRNSYPWTVYAHLDTHHVEGDACVVCSRLHKREAGWSCGLHSEVFNSGRGVGLGMNIEMTNEYAGPDEVKMIGLNVQATGGRPSQYGIQVHDGKSRFEKGIGLNGTGQVGLDLAGQYGVGVHAHGNSIRLNEGTCIELEQTGRIRIRYRAGRIEFLNGDTCVGHLRVEGEDHAL